MFLFDNANIIIMMEKGNFIVDTNKYSLGLDIDGKENTTEDLHSLLLKIVLELDRICRKYNIPYALSYGSALGLYNYGGFIPWDDDMDIAIDYFDIPRLVEALKKDLSDEFSFDCYETNKRFNVLIPTFKIRYKNSYIKETYYYTLPNRCHNGDGIFIDIVAFMGVPEDPKEHMKLIKYAKRRMPLYVFFDAYLRIHPYLKKKMMKRFERKVAEKYRSSNRVSQTVIIPFQDWGDEKEYLSYPREVIYPFKEYDFMGHKLFSFNDVKEFCRLCYGIKSLKYLEDGVYKEPLPLEKRNAKHHKAYSLIRKKK